MIFLPDLMATAALGIALLYYRYRLPKRYVGRHRAPAQKWVRWGRLSHGQHTEKDRAWAAMSVIQALSAPVRPVRSLVKARRAVRPLTSYPPAVPTGLEAPAERLVEVGAPAAE